MQTKILKDAINLLRPLILDNKLPHTPAAAEFLAASGQTKGLYRRPTIENLKNSSVKVISQEAVESEKSKGVLGSSKSERKKLKSAKDDFRSSVQRFMSSESLIRQQESIDIISNYANNFGSNDLLDKSRKLQFDIDEVRNLPYDDINRTIKQFELTSSIDEAAQSANMDMNQLPSYDP